MIMVASIAAGLAVAGGLFRAFFDGWHDFWECLMLSLTPDIVCLCRGELGESIFAELKLLAYAALSAGGGFLTHQGLHRLFG